MSRVKSPERKQNVGNARKTRSMSHYILYIIGFFSYPIFPCLLRPPMVIGWRYTYLSLFLWSIVLPTVFNFSKVLSVWLTGWFLVALREGRRGARPTIFSMKTQRRGNKKENLKETRCFRNIANSQCISSARQQRKCLPIRLREPRTDVKWRKACACGNKSHNMVLQL